MLDLIKQRETQRRWRAANPDKLREYSRRYASKNKERNKRWLKTRPDKALQYARASILKMRTHHLKTKYGLTEEAFASLLAGQGHCCAICKTNTNGGRAWSVDHSHVSGAIRGLLCTKCNSGLGFFNDNPVT